MARPKAEGVMNNPKVVAAVSGIAVIFLAFSIFGPSDEAPSSALNAMNWVFFLLALVACIGSIVLIMKGTSK